jgi:hypothetical protein
VGSEAHHGHQHQHEDLASKRHCSRY